MTPERWQRINEIVAMALEVPVEDRGLLIDKACNGDSELQREVSTLLAHAPAKAVILPEFGHHSLLPNVVFDGKYVIVSKLGEGGFATTFLARSLALHDRLVALKVLKVTEMDDWARKKFKDEMQALSRIHDPGVVVPVESSEVNNPSTPGKPTPYIVMEFVDGPTLKEVLKGGRLPLARIAGLVLQIGRSLAAVHLNRVYHRDLKPGNIILQSLTDGSDHVRLIDFGIASVLEPGSATGAQTQVAGSMHYMAPEQLHNHVSKQSDIFSFGAIVYEMTTGVVPFPADNFLQLEGMHRKGLQVSPRLLCPNLPESAERLIVHSLSRAPEARPADAAIFGKELSVALLGSTPPALSNWPSRRVVLASCGVATVAAAGAGIALNNFRKTPVQPPPNHPPSVQVVLRVREPDGKDHVLKSDRVVLRRESEFRLEIFGDSNGHLYVLSDSGDDTNALTSLFPRLSGNSSDSRFRANSTAVIPADSWLAFGPSVGSDRLWIVWSQKAVSSLEAVRKWTTEEFAGKIGSHDEQRQVRSILKRADSPRELTEPLIRHIDVDHK